MVTRKTERDTFALEFHPLVLASYKCCSVALVALSIFCFSDALQSAHRLQAPVSYTFQFALSLVFGNAKELQIHPNHVLPNVWFCGLFMTKIAVLL